MKPNDDVILKKAKEKEFIEYEGYLPHLIWSVVPLFERAEYLRERGIYDEICDLQMKCRRFSYEEDLQDLKEWVDEHPEYSDFIIED